MNLLHHADEKMIDITEEPLISIGIDLGTSGCRVIAIDQHRHSVASHQQAISQTGTEQDPKTQWQTVKQVLSHVIKQCDGLIIQAITVDATSGSVMMTNQYGRPLTPMLMYHDNRALEQSHEISHYAPPQSGAHGPTSGLAKLCYFQQQTLQTESLLVHQADWINFNLGAPLGITDENNALKTGYDPTERCWPQWLTHVTNTKYLPEVVPVGKKIGQLSKDLCQEFKLPNQPNIIAGTTDSIAAVIATGINQVGQAVTSLGSTLVVKLISNQPIFVAEQGIYSHRLANIWLVGGASNTGGAVLRHFFNDQMIEQLSHQIDLAAPTLDYYPLLTVGERFPVNDPTLKPRLTPRSDSDVTFYHSLLQSMANIEQLAYQALEAAGTLAATAVYTVGGGSKNTVWQTIRQQTLKVPVLTPNHTEAAYGSALIAQGYIDSLFRYKALAKNKMDKN